MYPSSAPVVKDLVLLGGGHAQVSVLKSFGMNPVPGLRLTLITRDIHTPYSGMLPGFISGFYDYDACHIDLGPLARFAAARMYHGEVEGLDLRQQRVILPNRPPVHYDLLSINIGSRPQTLDIPGALEHALVAKPINLFLQRWQALQQCVVQSEGDFRILVIGAGAGGVELSLSCQHKLQSLLAAQGDDPDRLKFSVIHRESRILSTHPAAVAEKFERIFQQRNISVVHNCAVTAVTESCVSLDDGRSLAADAVIWVTSASAPQWPAEAGLDVDGAGFIRVNQYLQSTSHDNVFAAGDIAALPEARPKSGVFAVRQGPILYRNLRRAADGRPLLPYRPQKRYLSLISTGNRNAVASRGQWSLQGRLLWRWKDWIDQRFMRNFNQLPAMSQPDGDNEKGELADSTMRCGGCGAKVGADVLQRALRRLPQSVPRDDVLLGREAADDAALLAVPEGKLLVQSVDYFRAFMGDAYTFAAIAANHALGDLYAMAAQPQSVQAIATVPYARPSMVEETLYEMLAGATSIVEAAGAVLSGGHSSEGVELAFGLSVNGLVNRDEMWLKDSVAAGDCLILTKALGTGTLLAADMRCRAKGRWIDSAIHSMLHSNQQAVAVLQQYGASACTDITGFGLLGHLLEMLRDRPLQVELRLDELPLLDGAAETSATGIVSTLYSQNLAAASEVQQTAEMQGHPHYPLLFDPQTAGGLLATLPASQGDACLQALHAAGYPDARVIGTVQSAITEPGILSRITKVHAIN